MGNVQQLHCKLPGWLLTSIGRPQRLWPRFRPHGVGYGDVWWIMAPWFLKSQPISTSDAVVSYGFLIGDTSWNLSSVTFFRYCLGCVTISSQRNWFKQEPFNEPLVAQVATSWRMMLPSSLGVISHQSMGIPDPRRSKLDHCLVGDPRLEWSPNLSQWSPIPRTATATATATIDIIWFWLFFLEPIGPILFSVGQKSQLLPKSPNGGAPASKGWSLCCHWAWDWPSFVGLWPKEIWDLYILYSGNIWER